MAKRKRSNRKVWARRVKRLLKKGARLAWKIARLVIRRLARLGRAMWRATFPRKRRRRHSPSQPSASVTAPSRSQIRVVSPSAPTSTGDGQPGLFVRTLAAITARLRQRAALFRLPVAVLFIALTVAAIAFWRSEPGEETCVLRERIALADIQRPWPSVRRWCPLIMQAAHRHHLDPHLIAALILVESGGNPQAYSSSGAVGLMQVMPRDGIAASFQCAAGPCFADRPTIAQLRDPAFNVDYGAMLLQSNVERYGSLRRALRAYGPLNMGYRYADLVLATYERVRP